MREYGIVFFSDSVIVFMVNSKNVFLLISCKYNQIMWLPIQYSPNNFVTTWIFNTPFSDYPRLSGKRDKTIADPACPCGDRPRSAGSWQIAADFFIFLATDFRDMCFPQVSARLPGLPRIRSPQDFEVITHLASICLGKSERRASAANPSRQKDKICVNPEPIPRSPMRRSRQGQICEKAIF